jgi:hypothetical protein
MLLILNKNLMTDKKLFRIIQLHLIKNKINNKQKIIIIKMHLKAVHQKIRIVLQMLLFPKIFNIINI